MNQKKELNNLKNRGNDNMPDRDGKGPRQRSPRPSRPKAGMKKGNC